MSNCLVTGGCRQDTAPIAVLLMNVRQTQSWVDHVVVFHDGISRKDQALMQQIIPVEFIRYRFPGCTNNFNEIVRYVYTPLVFCKYECFKLLSRFENVVWTDYDAVIKKDLSHLILDNPSGFKSLIYRKSEQVYSFKAQFRHEIWDDLKKQHHLESASIATGLFCLSSALVAPNRIYDLCVSLTEKYGKYLVLPDQAILNMVIDNLDLNLGSIPWTYAVHPTKEPELVADAIILHAYAQPKFWNGLYNEIWQKNYDQWLSMGGSPWRKFSLSSFIRKCNKSIRFVIHRYLSR